MRGPDIARARDRLGLSREEIGRIIGCDKSTVARWEVQIAPNMDPAFRRLLDVVVKVGASDELVALGIGKMLRREMAELGDLYALYRLLELHFEREDPPNAD